MAKQEPYFVYNKIKELVGKMSNSNNLLHFAEKYGYKDYISALVDEEISDKEYKKKYKDGYDKIMNIDPFRISKGDEHRIEPRTHMEFARTLVANFILEDIYIELFNRSGVKCEINDDDKDRDIIDSGNVHHKSDLIFNINGNTINVELKNYFQDTKSFTLTNKQIEGYTESGGVILIVKPLLGQYSIIDITKINWKLSKSGDGTKYCFPVYKKFSFTKRYFKEITKEISIISSTK